MTSSAGATKDSEIAASQDSTTIQHEQSGTSASLASSAKNTPQTVRILLGITLIVLGLLACTVTERGIESQKSSLLTLLLAGIALLTSLYEGTCTFLNRSRFENPLEFFPAAGTFLLAIGALASVLSVSQPGSIFISSGPIIAAGLLLVIRAVLAQRSSILDNQSCLLMPVATLSSRVTNKGDKLSLAKDSAVPADCKIESGCVSVLERYLSPETHFRVREEGDIVFAGSEIVGGSAEAVALSSNSDSCLRSLENLVVGGVTRAGTSLQREDLRARRATAYILLFVAVASAILWDERSGNAWNTMAAAGLVLFSAIICQLADVLYAHQLEMVRRWAGHGFVASSDAAVRELASATSALFDPSRVDLGSLVKVRALEVLDDRVGPKELCACLGALLGRAEDVALASAGSHCQEIAGAIVPDRVLDLREVPGGGIRGSLKGVPVTVGTEEFLLEQGILIHPSESNIETADNERPILVAIGGELVARFWLAFGQQYLLSDEARSREWRGLMPAALATGVAGEITENTLLVRGQESDVLGRTVRLQLALFAGDRFELPRSTLVALTPSLAALPSILWDCHRFLRAVERARILIAFGVFVSVAAVFLGVFSPVIPAVLLLLAATTALLF